jgi:hypothetical protein
LSWIGAIFVAEVMPGGLRRLCVVVLGLSGGHSWDRGQGRVEEWRDDRQQQIDALFPWCLQQGLQVVQVMTLMSLGPYNEPFGAYMPSVLY